MKRIFSILLSICLLLSIVPAGTFTPAVSAEPAETVVNTDYITVVHESGYYGTRFTVGPEAGLTRQDVGAYLRFCLLKGCDHFGYDAYDDHYLAVITYYDSESADEDTLDKLLGDAIGYGCFTRATISSAIWEAEAESGGLYRNTVVYSIPNMLISDSQKVEYTIETVETIIRELNLEGMSDYDKILAICQYICEIVEYGYDDDNDCYSAYGALKNGLAVCDGYHDLTYALLMEAGIDTACVSGKANGGSHAWNIVLLDGLYYNLDTTWADDVYYPGMDMDMSWILRGARDFPGHFRGSRYATDSFNARYPMATTKYDGTPGTLHNCNGEHKYEVVDPSRDISVRPTMTTPGKILLTCAWCNISNYFEMPALSSDAYDCVVDAEVTCTTEGKTTYWWKGYSLGVVEKTPATGHDYVDGICTACGVAGAHEWAAATCTKPATCTLCGAKEGSALGHSWMDATCLTYVTCSVCGSINGDIGDHDWLDATCTEPATCAVCGLMEGDANGHSWKNATCTTPKTCTVCGLTSGSANGHNWASATCTAPTTCTDCGAQEGKIGVHGYDDGLDGTCNFCGIHRETTEDRTVMHMFRMYDPNSGEHFYTGSVEERENLVAAGWNYEGVGFTFSRTTGLPVYRLYDPYCGEHLYTMETPEKTRLQFNGKDLYGCEGRLWLYEGIAFNSAYDTEVPQYRLRNPNAFRGAYHFTSSAEERDNLIAAGWIYEGICFYSSWK